MTGAVGEGRRPTEESAGVEHWRARAQAGRWSPEALVRSERILVTMLAAVLVSGAAGFFSLNATMNARFTAMDGKFTAMDGKFTAMDAKFTATDAKFDSRFTAMEAQFTAMEAQFTAVNGHLLSLQAQIGQLDARIARLEALFEAHLANEAPPPLSGASPRPPPDS